MKVLVIGGTGLIGGKLVSVLTQRGDEVVVASPATGVDVVTGDGLSAALDHVDVVVDLANSPSFEDEAALTFFEKAGQNLASAERIAGVRHHVALSVVGSDRLPDSGYLRAKLAQEALIKASGTSYTILRSTQFFEFLEKIRASLVDGSVIRSPVGKIQPVAADDVVAALADIVGGPPANATFEICGPQEFRMDALMAFLAESSGDTRQVLADTEARYFGAVLGERSLLPDGANARVGTTRLSAWLASAQLRPEVPAAV